MFASVIWVFQAKFLSNFLRISLFANYAKLLKYNEKHLIKKNIRWKFIITSWKFDIFTKLSPTLEKPEIVLYCESFATIFKFINNFMVNLWIKRSSFDNEIYKFYSRRQRLQWKLSEKS